MDRVRFTSLWVIKGIFKRVGVTVLCLEVHFVFGVLRYVLLVRLYRVYWDGPSPPYHGVWVINRHTGKCRFIGLARGNVSPVEMKMLHGPNR